LKFPSSKMVCVVGAIKVFVKDLAEFKIGILLREGFITPSFFNKVSLTNWICTKPNYKSAQRHTLGMWSSPLLNDELGLYPFKSWYVCQSVECTNYESTNQSSYVRSVFLYELWVVSFSTQNSHSYENSL